MTGSHDMHEDQPPGLRQSLHERYRVHEEIARGGMGIVYRAEDLVTGTEVAVKVLRPQIAAVLGAGRFLREIRILAMLRHPSIVPLLDSGDASGSLYYVTPFIRGSSLQRLLEREGPLPLPEVLRIGRDVATALDYAHRTDVIHRDVKPGNVLMGQDRALVCDFGVARAVEIAGGDVFASSSGFALGTPAYMSPEQATAGAIDRRADVYGLACVLYEMLAGEPAFTGATAQAILARSLSGDIRPLGAVRPELPAAAEAAIRSGLASDPDRRPATAGELLVRFGDNLY